MAGPKSRRVACRAANIDAYDGTPVIELKAYFPVGDPVKQAHIPD